LLSTSSHTICFTSIPVFRVHAEQLTIQARSTAEEVSSLLKTNERLAKQAEESAKVSADREAKLKCVDLIV
jgi:hypothetical protein